MKQVQGATLRQQLDARSPEEVANRSSLEQRLAKLKRGSAFQLPAAPCPPP